MPASARSVDQRDAVPKVLWAWTEQTSRDAEHWAALEAALAATGPGYGKYVLEKVLHDQELFSFGMAHLLARYATLVDAEFQALMRALFDTAFKQAPVKTVTRMRSKVKADLPGAAAEAALRAKYGQLYKTSGHFAAKVDKVASRVDAVVAAYEDYEVTPEALHEVFQLGDLVRGSVTCDGPDAVLAALQKLTDRPAEQGRSFEAWRVKNTHHPKATTVGGYRDVKVLGKLSAGDMSMVVEIQLIDKRFLEIKKYMHKAYAIKRGDFG